VRNAGLELLHGQDRDHLPPREESVLASSERPEVRWEGEHRPRIPPRYDRYCSTHQVAPRRRRRWVECNLFGGVE
jgi:hypothetical protein